jgi:hypothetical protein
VVDLIGVVDLVSLPFPEVDFLIGVVEERPVFLTSAFFPLTIFLEFLEVVGYVELSSSSLSATITTARDLT